MCREPLCPFGVLPRQVQRYPPHRKALPLPHSSYGLMRQTKTLPHPSALASSVGLCRLLPVPAGRWPFPTLSLQSLHSCLDPYPAVFLRCSYPFLPEELRPHVRSETFGTPNYSCIATSAGHAFRGCSHSVMFRPPCSLDPQVAPTATQKCWAAGPFTPRNGHAVTRHELWYRYMPESGNWHGGTLTRWIAALPAAPQVPSMRNYRTGLLPQVRRRNVDSGKGVALSRFAASRTLFSPIDAASDP